MAETNKKIEVAKPYHDINTPFSIDEHGALAEYIVNDPEKMPSLALGATILIRDTRKRNNLNEGLDFWYSGRIIGLKAVSPFNPERTSMLYQQDEQMDPSQPLESIHGPHTHQPMVIKVALSQEWNFNGKKHNSSAIQKPPSGYSRLFFPKLSSNSDDNSPSLQTILGVKEHGLELGMIGFGNKPYGWNQQSFIPYKWDIDHLDNKHMFIVGESGSGKTVLLKNLAYQIRKNSSKNKVILTDVQGDISQLLFWDFVKHVKADGWRPKISKEQYKNAKKEFGKFRLIIPMTKDEYAESEVSEIEELALNRDVDVRRISLRFQDLDSPKEAEYLFRTSSDQVSSLLEELVEGLKGNINEFASISRLQSALSRLLNKSSSNQIVVPTSGVSFYRSTFQAAQRVLRDMENYFDMDPMAIDQSSNPLDSFNHNGTTILYLDHLNQDERFMWEMQLVNWLYRNKKDMQDTYVFFDEAHQIIPRDKNTASGISKEVLSRLRSNFEKLAREGRKFRLNLILSTQSPQDLHPIVQDQCPTRIVMKMNAKNATYAGLDSGLAYIANSFNQGQFWIQSPFNGTPDWVRVHSVAPPVPHDSMENFRDSMRNQSLF